MIFAKILATLINALLGITTTLCCFAWTVTAEDIGYTFVVLKSLVISGYRLPPLPVFDLLATAKTVINPIEMSRIIVEMNILAIVPFAIGAIIWLIGYNLTGRIIRAVFNRKTTLHGSSRWATDAEMKKAGLMGENGLVLGQTFDARYKDTKDGLKLADEGTLLLQNSSAHTLLVGSTRSGKGVSCIIPTEFMWKDSIIIFDPKAEGWDVSASFRSKFSYTFKFQPEKPRESIHYNPLLAIRRGTQTISDIQNLSHILIPDNPGAKDPFWDNEGRKLLSTVIGYVIYCEPPENKTFKYVYSIFTRVENLEEDNQKPKDNLQGEERGPQHKTMEQSNMLAGGEDVSLIKKFLIRYSENCKKYMETMPDMPDGLYHKFMGRYGKNVSKEERFKIEEEAKAYLTKEDKDTLDSIYRDLIYFSQSPDQQLASVVSSMTTQLQVIADPNVQALTDRSDFLMEDLMDGIMDKNGQRHPISLYLCVSLESMSRLVPLMRIIYEQAIRLLTRELAKRPYRLLLVFDEFYQMGNMEIVNKALALSAGYGIYCCVAIQSYEQLRILYKSDAQFVDNFAYQVILRVNDQSTCDKIEKTLGKETKKHVKINSSGRLGQLTHQQESYDTQELGRSLMTAEEVRTMDDNECIIISSGRHPYRAKKVRYYLDDRFRKLYIDKKTGKAFPPPLIDDNYPHPEIMKFDENGKIISNPGLDCNGWHLLLGFNAAMEGIMKAEETEALGTGVKVEEKGESDDRRIIENEDAGTVKKEPISVSRNAITPDLEIDEKNINEDPLSRAYLKVLNENIRGFDENRHTKTNSVTEKQNEDEILQDLLGTTIFVTSSANAFREREASLGISDRNIKNADSSKYENLVVEEGYTPWKKDLLKFYEDDKEASGQ